MNLFSWFSEELCGVNHFKFLKAMRKPVLKLRENRQAQLLKYAENVLIKLTQHADIFVDPQPALPVLEAALQAYRESLAEASFRDRRAVTIKNQRKKELETVIYELSLYVDQVAKGDPAIVLAAGFETVSRGRSSELSPKAENLRVEAIGVGTGLTRLRVKPWKRAKVYRFEYRKKAADEAWNILLHTKSVCRLDQLELLQEYEFRVAYVGTGTSLMYSDVVSAYVV